MAKFTVEMDESTLEKVQAGFPDLKFVKVEETEAGGEAEAPEGPEAKGE